MDELIERYASRLKWISIFLFIIAILLFILYLSGQIPSSDMGDQINIAISMFTIVSLIATVMSFYAPKLLIKAALGRPAANRMSLLMTIPALRLSAFFSIAFYGLILGLLGADTVTAALFFLASIAGILLIFPTRMRLKKLSEQLFPEDNNDITY